MNIGGRECCGLLSRRLLLEPHLGALEPDLVARPQVLVADALRAREQRVVELHRIEVEIAVDVLEPLGRVARRALQPQHLGSTLLFVTLEAAAIVGSLCRYSASAMALSSASFVPEPTEKCAVAAASPISTRFSCDHFSHSTRRKLSHAEPRRCLALVASRCPPRLPGEDAFARRDRLLLAHGVEAEPAPRRLRALDDERRGLGVELVGVRPDPAVLGLLEDERERVLESLPGAEPDVLAGAHVDVRLEHVRQGAANLRVGAVGRDDQIVVAVAVGALELGLELQGDAQRTRPVLQDVEQALAADAAEAVARRAGDGAAVEDGDVVPVDERAPDRVGALGIAGVEIDEGLVRQHHAPPEGVVRPVALDDDDLVAGLAPLHGDREVEPGRSPAETGNAHSSDYASPAKRARPETDWQSSGAAPLLVAMRPRHGVHLARDRHPLRAAPEHAPHVKAEVGRVAGSADLGSESRCPTRPSAEERIDDFQQQRLPAGRRSARSLRRGAADP